MRIGITGAGGFIGSRIMNLLLEKNHEVVGIDAYTGKFESIRGNKIIKSNIEDFKRLEILFKNCDAIIHLAAVSGLMTCDEKPDLAYTVNMVGTQNVGWVCKKHKIPLIFPVSMAIFGNPQSFPVKENDPKRTINFYGLTKLIGLKNIQLLSENNFPAHIFIKSNVYGEHEVEGFKMMKKTVINAFIDKAKNNEVLTVNKPGTQARDFIHVKDVADAYLCSLRKIINDEPITKLYNIASGQTLSILDIANIVKNIAIKKGYKTDIQLIENPRMGEVTVENFAIDTTKAKEELKFQAKINIEDTVVEMI